MRLEAYSASVPQEGKSPTSNEDAVLIRPTLVALADGAGNAQQAAKKALGLLEKLVSDTSISELAAFPTWTSIVRMLDSSLLGGNQSTLVTVAVLGDRLAGFVVGDSRAYLISGEGKVTLHCDQPF